MPLQIGQILFNQYRVERLLGEGSFGIVYEATQLRLQRKVAIKELKEQLADDRVLLKRFVNEAKVIATISSPYIVSLLSYESENNQHYMILEYMDGGSLSNLLKQRGRLTLSEATRIAYAVCMGLAAAHRLGIIHRDIKPANILLHGGSSVAKLSDFGIAHVPAALGGLTPLTVTGTTMGTIYYMSPEQARGDVVDVRGDLYSVGAMLYEMVAGHSYVEFTSNLLVNIEKIQTYPPSPMSSDVPFGLQQIISKSLAKSPDQRFQSAEEFAMALRPFTTKTKTPDRAYGLPVSPKPPLLPRSNSTLPIMIAGFAIAALALLLLLVAVLATRTSVAVSTPVNSLVAVAATETVMPSAIPTVTRSPQPTAAPPTIDSAAATKAADATLSAIVIATLTAAAPTPTRTPTPTHTAVPSATSRPTLAPTSTSTPTPTLTPIPAITFLGIEWEPTPPHTGVNMSFYAIFNNTFPDPQWIEWTIQLRDADQDQKWQNAWTFRRQTTTIAPGRSRVLVNPNEEWRISKNERIKNFVARAVFMNQDKIITKILTTPDGVSEFPIQLTAQ